MSEVWSQEPCLLISAAHDTISHKLLLNKIYRMTSDIKLTDLIGNMLSNRRYFVELNGQKSRWRNQKNGLPQGSVISPVLFNIYTNDQPIHKDTRIYADDLCIATQDASFEKTDQPQRSIGQHWRLLREEPFAC